MLKFTRDSVCELAARWGWFCRAAMVLAVVAPLAMPGGALAQGGGGGASGAPRVQPMRTASVDQSAVEEPRFDLRFEGGTVADYLEAIQEASGKRNIVAMANTDRVPMPRVILDGVNTMAAVLLLDNMRVRNEAGSMFEVNVRSTMEVTRVSVLVLEEREGALARHDASQRGTAVHGLAGLLSEETYTVNAILSAIEVALEMAGDSGARLRYHEETRMLFVHGTGLEHATVRNVLEELSIQAAMMPQEEISEADRLGQQLMSLNEQIDAEMQSLRHSSTRARPMLGERISMIRNEIATLEAKISTGEGTVATNEEIALQYRALERVLIEQEQLDTRMRHSQMRLEYMLEERSALQKKLSGESGS